MSRAQLAATSVLAILWVGILIAVLIKGSFWHRDRSELEESGWLKGMEKAASIWMLLLVVGLCCMISLVLLNFFPE
jgi:hypothetical protein